MLEIATLGIVTMSPSSGDGDIRHGVDPSSSEPSDDENSDGHIQEDIKLREEPILLKEENVMEDICNDDSEAGLETDRLNRTLFVGNVSIDANKKDVRRLFTKYGDIETVRIRNIVPESSKLPKKVALLAKRMARFVDSYSAYVVFAPAEDVDAQLARACTELHFAELKGKHIRVTPAIVTRTGPKRMSAFIGNVPYDCSEEEFITTFLPIAKQLGTNLLNVRLNRDQDTGVCRGTGYVSLSDEVAIQALINMSDEIRIRKNNLRISVASKDNHKRSRTHKLKRKRGKGQNRKGGIQKPNGKSKGGKWKSRKKEAT